MKERKRRIAWIQPNLRVRIINKKSQFYNSKVLIHDIIDSSSFTVITENQQIVEHLREKDLETVIPGM